MEPNQPNQDQNGDRSGGTGEPASGVQTAATAALAIGCVSLVLGILALGLFVMTAFVFMDNPQAAQPFETAIKALFAVGLGSFLLGCVLRFPSGTKPQ